MSSALFTSSAAILALASLIVENPSRSSGASGGAPDAGCSALTVAGARPGATTSRSEDAPPKNPCKTAASESADLFCTL